MDGGRTDMETSVPILGLGLAPRLEAHVVLVQYASGHLTIEVVVALRLI
jgi:hypothetical protein